MVCLSFDPVYGLVILQIADGAPPQPCQKEVPCQPNAANLIELSFTLSRSLIWEWSLQSFIPSGRNRIGRRCLNMLSKIREELRDTDASAVLLIRAQCNVRP